MGRWGSESGQGLQHTPKEEGKSLLRDQVLQILPGGRMWQMVDFGGCGMAKGPWGRAGEGTSFYCGSPSMVAPQVTLELHYESR